jgi:hypothetical protein
LQYLISHFWILVGHVDLHQGVVEVFAVAESYVTWEVLSTALLK